MLKTNSRQARENLKAYIMNGWNINEEEQGRTWAETKADILAEFECDAWATPWQKRQNRQDAFINWLGGLPAALGDFFLYRGVEDLGNILEETEEERSRYTEAEAQTMLARLIYREVTRC